MNSPKSAKPELKDAQVDVKLKLAASWASFMFLYIYVDHFAFFMPGNLANILNGKVFVFDITQAFLMIALVSVSIPALMIFLSVALPAKVNRMVNLSIAAVFIPYTLFNLSGETWMHMIYGAAVEVILLCLIFRLAWKWPAVEV